ncbi:MAG: hypothetical protein LBR25_02780 [Erysipelotrichaceae bacterium]|jgi:predicted PurR-regulated permease PerM|nr:hypothetical protein [Erysipelotrichaceae bacterium]
MEPFLNAFSEFCRTLLPILGVVVLVFLAIILWHLIDFAKGLKTTVAKANDAIGSVDDTVKKLQGPLTTVEHLTGTVDFIFASTYKSATSLVKFMADNADSIKSWLASLLAKFQKNKSGKEIILEENTDE